MSKTLSSLRSAKKRAVGLQVTTDGKRKKLRIPRKMRDRIPPKFKAAQGTKQYSN